MSTDAVTTLILDALADFGTMLLAVVGACLVIGIGALVFREGKRFMMDESYSLGGYYLRKLPYNGYRRFRSKNWNMEHMA